MAKTNSLWLKKPVHPGRFVRTVTVEPLSFAVTATAGRDQGRPLFWGTKAVIHSQSFSERERQLCQVRLTEMQL